MSSILSVQELSKVFTNSQTKKTLTILDNVNFEIAAGESFAIVGPSGSGKTTLLGLCAGLDQVTSGSIVLNNIKLDHLTEDQLAKVRNEHVGFVFQNFQLIPTLTALENVMIPLELRGEKGAEKVAKSLLERVGLSERMGHYPVQLSGGEQQRVSIARAFSNNPKILFADEPTGNLDEETSNSIENLLFEINKESGTTLVIVTHDLELADKTDKRIRLKGGKIVVES
ncbi:MAG: ABC transporter ATP-binding protein [Bacteroidota bacterium]